MKSLPIKLGEVDAVITADHALWLPVSRALVIADVHFGKSATFRRRGLPVPEGDTEEDVLRIEALVRTHGAQQLIIAGDLMHAAGGMSEFILTKLSEFFHSLGLLVTLTVGNHDRQSELSALPIELVDFIEIDGLHVCHDPDDLPMEKPGVSGHLHPCYRLSAGGRQKEYLKGFYLKHPHHLILPAFSQFTGCHRIEPAERDRFFASVAGKLYEIPLGS